MAAVCGDRTRGNGQQLDGGHRKFHTSMCRNFCTARATERWNRLPREAGQSPSRARFKTRLDTYLLCPLLEGACFGTGSD